MEKIPDIDYFYSIDMHIFLRLNVELQERVQIQHRQHNAHNLLENKELHNSDVYYHYLNQ